MEWQYSNNHGKNEEPKIGISKSSLLSLSQGDFSCKGI